MSWSEIKSAYSILASSLKNPDKIPEDWEKFQRAVNSNPTPYHLSIFVHTIKDHQKNSKNSDVSILDHGCGGGLTLLYLLAIGYSKIYGVDVNDSDCEKWNILLETVFAIKEKRFFRYNGLEVPVESASIDIIVSQEVLEHVNDECVEAYYREEYRILKQGGLVLHSVPHKFTPYDSHTQTWFLHCILSRKYWLKALAVIGRSNATAEIGLFLRSPNFHKKMLDRHFSSYSDVTLERLMKFQNFDYYDGPKSLRRLMDRLMRAPGVGGIFQKVLRNLVMIDTVATKE